MNTSVRSKGSPLPDHEQILDGIRDWLRKHARDPQAGLMLQDYLHGNCSHDFVSPDTLVCDLCDAPTAEGGR